MSTIKISALTELTTAAADDLLLITDSDASASKKIQKSNITQENFTTTLKNKLDGVEAGATADQTAQEIATAIDADVTAETTLKSALGLGSAAYTASTDYATAAQGTNADTAYGWGDHSTEGYLTSYTETDPVVGAVTGAVKADGAGNISAAAITDLSDVYSSMSPTDGQVLTYDTTNGWQAETPAAGYADSDVDTHLNTSTATTGQMLSWDGSDYDWATVASFEAGTKMLFQQTTAPTGWTKDTTHNDKALRVVSGTAGSGGSVAFTTAFASKAVSGTVGNTTLTTAKIPSHSHNIPRGLGSYAAVNTYYPLDTPNGSTATTSTGGGGSHNHSFTGTAINMAVEYVDLIIATKD